MKIKLHIPNTVYKYTESPIPRLPLHLGILSPPLPLFFFVFWTSNIKYLI